MARSLLVPLDGSPLAETALPWAVEFARAHDLAVTLVQVLPWPIHTLWAGPTGYVSAQAYEALRGADREAAAAYLADVQQRLASQGTTVETVWREGVPASIILDVADERGAAAIVLCTHGRGGLSRLVLGSVAEQLVAEATLPLLLVRAREGAATPAPALTRIVVPTDGSALAARALDLARDTVADGGTLILVRVIAPVERLSPGIGVPRVYVDEQGSRAALARARDDLQLIADTLPHDRFTVETVVRMGRPAPEIAAAAREHGATLIALTTHGDTGPKRWVLGSVADAVVRTADTPVLLVSTRALAARALGPFTVADVMTRDLAAVRVDEPLIGVLRKLLRRQVSGAPVVDADGQLVGIVSEHDLLNWEAGLLGQLASDPSLTPRENARRLAAEPVSRVMTAPAISIEASAPLAAALRMMTEHRLRRLPVVADGRLAGIVTRGDVLRALATLWDAAVEPESSGTPS